MVTRRQFLTAATGTSAAAVAAGCTHSSGDDDVTVPTGGNGNGLVELEYDEYSETGELYDHSLDDYSGTPERQQWTDDPDGSDERVLEIPFGEGVDHAGNAVLALDHDDLGVATNEHGRTTRVYQQFQLYLPEEFELPAEDTLRFCFSGLSYSAGDAHSGGGRPDGTNGWSSRPFLTRRDAVDGSSAPDDGWHVGNYTYHMDQSSSEAGESAVYGDAVVYPGEWHTIETEVVCNRWAGVAADADGVTRCWVDGRAAYRDEGFRWTTTASNALEFCGFSGYYWPGSDGSPTEQSIYLKNHAVSTTPRSDLLARSGGSR